MSACDNASAGVLISDPGGRLLMFERVRPPVGIAPPAGHVDGHGGYELAARAEVAEEVGLTVISLDLVAEGWRPNRCRRGPGPFGVGHYWRVYKAIAAGDLAPAADETRNARWYTPAAIRELAARTVMYARGAMTPAEFATRPGLEPVWVRWLASGASWLIEPSAGSSAVGDCMTTPAEELRAAAATLQALADSLPLDAANDVAETRPPAELVAEVRATCEAAGQEDAARVVALRYPWAVEQRDEQLDAGVLTAAVTA